MPLLPRRLNAQIVLAVSCILLATGAVSGWISARTQAEHLLAAMRQTSAVIVRNLAESCTRLMLVENYAELETVLLASIELPDMRRLQLAEPDGTLIWTVERMPGHHATARTGIARFEVPRELAPALLETNGTLVVWQPIAAGKPLGWLRAEYGLESIREAQATTWRNTLLMTAGWVAATALLIVLVLGPIVRAMGRLTEFAKRLDAHVGEQIAIGKAPLEIEELAASLNETSAKLLRWEHELLARSESLRATNRKLRAISACNQTLIRATDEGRLLNDICRIACGEAGYRMAWVGYAQDDPQRSVRPMAWAGAEDRYLEHADVTWSDTERGQGPTGTAIRTASTSRIEDYATDTRVAPWRDEALRRGYRSSIALPLKDEDGRAVGALSIYSPEAHAFQSDEVAILDELASDLAFGIGALRTRAERQRADDEIRQLNSQLERRVAERTAQLEAANKELDAFAYSVSHDLRAPLRHIDGFIHMLRDDIEATLNDADRHYMDVIVRAARHEAALIDDLLSFSRMGRSEMMKSAVDLRALVDEVVHEQASHEGTRPIDWKIAELPVVVGDRAMLKLALVNLVANALKFTRRCATAEIGIGCTRTDGEVVVFVHDNGAGFDMKFADKLFGVFQRLHRPEDFEGTGIGLANVRRIIARHGGRTWAEGTPGGGATFYFSLPATDSSATKTLP